MEKCENKLTSERLRELLHYDPETGIFRWRAGRQGVPKTQTKAGYITKNGYRSICVDYFTMREHVLAWLYMNGEWPTNDIDHRNGIRDDNRWGNLRDVTRGINMQNLKKARCDNKSGLLGVSPNHKRWSASIKVDGIKLHLGTFDTPTEAHNVYLSAKREMHVGNTL
jgi:hypothetical protein